MSEPQIIGTCSVCGGPVYTYVGPWHGINPPPKWCGHCGATPSYGPTIPMKPDTQAKGVDWINDLPLESQRAIREFWKGDGWKP